jgi:hypothetical protein
MSLGFALPVIFSLLAFDLLRRDGGLTFGWRQAWLGGAIVTGTFLMAMTEILSAFHALTSISVALFWTAGIVGLLVLRRRVPGRLSPSFRRTFATDEPLVQILVLLIAGLAGILAFLALLAVPNSWDALTYHLPRVAHWYQNRSIAIFATSCMYQNQHCPFAEWSILNLCLLQGNDRLANMVEWGGYAGSIIAVSLLAEACGGSRKTAAIAAFFAATLPMAILQASSVQTDEILAFWLLCTAYGCIKIAARPDWPTVLFFALSLGLALLTKALAYLFAPAFCVWITTSLLRRGWRTALPRLLLIALIVLTLNAGYYTRNLGSTGTLLGSDADSGPGYRYENEIHTPGAIFSNAVRNLGLQAPQFPLANRLATSAVAKIDRLFGIDPSDPRTTDFAPRFYLPTAPLDDEVANPLHLAAIGLGFLILAIARKRFPPAAHGLALSVLAGAFFFCLVLKWQPFHSRLHLPLFLLAMPVAALALERGCGRIVTLLFIGLLIAEAVPLVFENYSHPLIGPSTVFNRPPDVQRFLIRPEARTDYARALQLLEGRHVRTLGVIGPADNSGWEYPLFAPDEMSFSFPWRVEQVGVTNFYAPLETKEIVDAVVTLVPAPEETVTVHGVTYHRALKTDALSVYLK